MATIKSGNYAKLLWPGLKEFCGDNYPNWINEKSSHKDKMAKINQELNSYGDNLVIHRNTSPWWAFWRTI